ncbi:nucleotidyltransferase domain-containing protein [Leifsonia poae]|uniref:nucleotidyltransferase domain-containing protein n=1 Tax=Leifsonia poae TaxID=110933 RepID=UPI001CBEEAF6|nr:nucleotidyltransferase domain-containing protein [Leifsonia poae]
MLDDAEFLDHVASALAELPGVLGVALGGSRAQGVSHPGSDWDFSLYYRSTFDASAVRGLGWAGEATDVGGWGPIFNGGGAFTVEGRPMDIHYRDLDLIDRIHDDAERGEFRIEPLLFHQAGIPTYILLAELGVNRVLTGDLPRWEYPDALRESAPPVWWEGARLTLHYARKGHAAHGRVAQCAGLLSEAACRTGHAILACNGEWITNEKQLLTLAGLREVDGVIARLSSEPKALIAAVDEVGAILRRAAAEAGVVDAVQRDR